MRVAPEARVEARHLLVQHRVARHTIVEVFLLRLRRQLAVEKQVAGLEEIAVLGKFVDRVAPVEEHAIIAVDVGDVRLAGGSRREARIVGEAARLGVKPAYVDDGRTDRPVADRKFPTLIADGQPGRLVHAREPPLRCH
jgi:hypothetical protein